jgi:hypothetical protein
MMQKRSILFNDVTKFSAQIKFAGINSSELIESVESLIKIQGLGLNIILLCVMPGCET